MRLDISRNDADELRVDRDGTANDHGRQGFDVHFIGGDWITLLSIHFEDEHDAARLAWAILARLGHPPEEPMTMIDPFIAPAGPAPPAPG